MLLLSGALTLICLKIVPLNFAVPGGSADVICRGFRELRTDRFETNLSQAELPCAMLSLL